MEEDHLAAEAVDAVVSANLCRSLEGWNLVATTLAARALKRAVLP